MIHNIQHHNNIPTRQEMIRTHSMPVFCCLLPDGLSVDLPKPCGSPLCVNSLSSSFPRVNSRNSKKVTPSSLELLLPQPTIQQKFTISADFLGRECQSSVFAAAHIVRQEGLRNFWWRHVAELNTISTSEGPSTKVLSCHYKYFARVLAVESVLENHETLQTQNNTVSIWL